MGRPRWLRNARQRSTADAFDAGWHRGFLRWQQIETETSSRLWNELHRARPQATETARGREGGSPHTAVRTGTVRGQPIIEV